MIAAVSDLLDKVKSYDQSKYVNYLEKAIKFAQHAHNGQKRHSGEDFFSHPLAVANILAAMSLDSLAIIGALLHDTVEDTNTSLKKITRNFGQEVADLVDGVTKITRIESKSETVIQAENFRKLIIAISKDIRVLLIKLADRLHNMQTLHYIKSTERRKKIALETMEIFVPLSERIGMHQIKNELQDLAFKNLYPDVRESIIARLELLKNDNAVLPQQIIGEIEALLKKHNFNYIQVLGREKTPFSIWDKMKRKSINFEQLSDVIAFRAIVTNVDECYRALGVIHNTYHAVPGKFKDFISTPKKNGYRSLHTVIIGPKKHKIELQIRTKFMHEIAEKGIAAHWCYKQNYNAKDRLEYSWIQGLLEILDVTADSSELLENTKLEMYNDQVFCFTPKGKVIALPKGASAIDFAYAVHSVVGNSCVGVRINKRLVPLRTKLQNGDQVEVITNDNHKPLPSWEKFAVTGKALSEIRKSMRQEKRQEYINLGRVIVMQLLAEEDIEFSEKILEPVLAFFSKNSLEDFFLSVGEGHVSRDVVLRLLLADNKTKKENDKFQFIDFADKTNNTKKLSIKGLVPGIAVHFASCCCPIPGDSIVGVQQSGKGVAVHVSDCEVLQNHTSYSRDWLDLAWSKNSDPEVYTVSINATIVNKPGSLATIAIDAARNDANISNFKVKSRSIDFFEIIIDVEVKGIHHLNNIIASLRSKSCVHSIDRHNVTA